MQVAYLLEYRQPIPDHIKKQMPAQWLAVGVVAAPVTLTPSAILDRVRDERPQLDDYELRARLFYPMPGTRVEGDESNVFVIESDVAPVVV